MEEKKLHVAIYCRVNRDDDLALNCQQEDMRSVAEKHGYLHPMYYLDKGASGLNLERPALTRLQADVMAGYIDAVLVHALSRIGRNYTDVVTWMRWLESQGVKLITS